MTFQQTNERATTRSAPSTWLTWTLLSPALAIVVMLFGGGLLLGLLQGLGYFPGVGAQTFTLQHFRNVLTAPEFLTSLGLTFYVSVTSTAIAVILSIMLALAFLDLSGRYRWLHFIFQIPLVVPHLVVGIATIFLLSPTGWFSRILQALGLITTSSDFPLLTNDRLGIGIIATYVWKEIPFITLMLFSVLRNAGDGLLDVGRTLNASRWQRVRYILLPMMLPGLFASSLIVFAYTFGAFEVPFLLGQTYPMLLPVWAYKNYADVDLVARPEGIAIGIIIAVIVALSIVFSHLIAHTAQQQRGDA